MAVVAAVSLAAGLGLSQLIESPAQAAADAAPPEAGPITVPVESRIIANDVTLRGDAVYDDPSAVRIEPGDADGGAVVTGHVPEVGATLDAASIALEVAGRPVVVLPGDLPTYRTLRAGMTGPDVSQLKAALRALGIEGGEPANTTFDATTAKGVEALYQKVGYEAPAPSKETKEQLTSATAAQRDAQDALATAQRALSKAGGGRLGSELVKLDSAITVATQQLAEAKALCEAPPPAVTEGEEGATGAPTCSQSTVARAQGELDAAVAERQEARAAPDTSAESAQVIAAQRAVADAKAQLAEAQNAVLTNLPASEIVFLPSLPRRVDEVTVKRGSTISGPVMTVSGASLEVVASAARADAELLTVGAVGSITIEGTEIPVTVSEVSAGTKDADESENGSKEGENGAGTSGKGSGTAAGRYRVTLTPGALTPEQLTLLQGTNVRVKIPVSSTGGEVLAVPIAALTAGPGGESRVELLGADKQSRLVTVETGLAAGGYVEIKGGDVALTKNDLVVVGTRGAAGDTTPGPTEESAG